MAPFRRKLREGIDGIYKILLSEIGQTFVSNCLVRSFDSQHFVFSTAAWFNIDTVFKDSHTTETVAVMTRPVMTALDGIINYDLADLQKFITACCDMLVVCTAVIMASRHVDRYVIITARGTS